LNFDVSAVFPVALEAEKFINAIELKCWGRLAQLAPMSYADASAFVQSIGVRSQKQFRKWRRGGMTGLPPVPEDLPANPDGVYKGRGWQTWGRFFGTGYESSKKRVFLPFEEARRFMHSVGLNSPSEWDDYCAGRLLGKGKKPENIPSRPFQVYKAEWQRWPDFLGYDPKVGRPWIPFPEARAFARSLKLPGQKAWKKYCAGGMPQLPARPENKIPTAPDSVYADDGWVNYGDWLGTGTIRSQERTYRDFHSARVFVRSLGICSATDYAKFIGNKLPGLPKRPLDIPNRPAKVYADKGWSGWDDFLGRSPS
jgi:hypothetical protein